MNLALGKLIEIRRWLRCPLLPIRCRSITQALVGSDAMSRYAALFVICGKSLLDNGGG
jgi:hypothetical protein